MKRFVEGEDRRQGVLLPEYLDDFVAEENQVRVIEAFVDELDLAALGFEGITPAATGRPSYHPSILLKIYVYGYINRIASSRRLDRKARAGLQDHRGLPEGQRCGDPRDVPKICRDVSAAEPVRPCGGGD